MVPTLIPSLRSSPESSCIPQREFSLAKRTTASTTEGSSGGRPVFPLLRYVHLRATSSTQRRPSALSERSGEVGPKSGLALELGHAAIWQSWGRDPTGPSYVLIGLCYTVVGINLLLLFYGGRPLNDRHLPNSP